MRRIKKKIVDAATEVVLLAIMATILLCALTFLSWTKEDWGQTGELSPNPTVVSLFLGYNRGQKCDAEVGELHGLSEGRTTTAWSCEWSSEIDPDPFPWNVVDNRATRAIANLPRIVEIGIGVGLLFVLAGCSPRPNKIEEWIAQQDLISAADDQERYERANRQACENFRGRVNETILWNFLEEQNIRPNSYQDIHRLLSGPMQETEMGRLGLDGGVVAAVGTINTDQKKKINIGFRRGMPIAAWPAE